jgi:hypothetical protein
MFPLDPHTEQVAESNEFTDMLVDEGMIGGRQNKPAIDIKLAMALRWKGGVTQEPNPPSGPQPARNLKRVSDLSRSWKYWNGLSL